MKTILAIVSAAVGLAPDATEADVASAFESQASDLFGATGARTLKGAADVASRNSKELDSLKLAHEAQKKAAEEAAERLAAIEAARKDAELSSLVASAVTSGRLPPAKREAFEANAKKHGVEWARATIDMLPVVASNEPPPVPPKAPTNGEVVAHLSPAILAEMKALGASEEDYAAAKARGHVS